MKLFGNRGAHFMICSIYESYSRSDWVQGRRDDEDAKEKERLCNSVNLPFSLCALVGALVFVCTQYRLCNCGICEARRR